MPEKVEAAMEELNRFLSFINREQISCILDHVLAKTTEKVAREEHLLMGREALLRRIREADEYTVLKESHDRLNDLTMEHFLLCRSVAALHEECTRYRDLLVQRTLLLVEREMSQAPPGSYALISMGSDGREEQTLITDQDYLLVYGEEGAGADRYYEKFSGILVERLAEIGFKKCTGDIMPTNPTWRGSLTQWSRRLTAIVRYEYEDYAKNLMDLIVLSDARFVAGDEKLAVNLVETIRLLEKEYFQVLWGMAKAATEMKLAIGFLKRIWTEGSGEHKGEFNLKLLAWAPLVMNIRILAINQGIPATNTVQRIELLEKEKSFSAATAEGLTEAYRVLTKHRILLQIRQIKGIQKDSYYLNPYTLGMDEREEIRQALLRIEELQKMIHINFSIV